MNNFQVESIEKIINSTPNKIITQKLSSVIYSLGRDAENIDEYDYAFSMLLNLYNRNNEDVRAEVIKAFSMLAVLKKEIKPLNRRVVEPLILESLISANGENLMKIQNAIDDINFALNWGMKY